MSFRYVATSALALAPVVASIACFGPTQMQVEVLTDLSCADDVRSALYVGGDPEPIGETGAESCKGGAPMSSLGDLVLTPGDRAGRSARVTVKARVAFGVDASGRRRQPADCERDASGCIFASRTFTYASHEQRRAPVRLYRDCIGKACGEGETCIQGAACVPDQVVCAGDDCAVAGEAPASTGGGRGDDGGASDGGPVDAGADVGAPAPRCTAPDGGDVVASASGPPTRTATSATAFFWIHVQGSTFEVWRLPRAGGGPAQSVLPPVTGTVEAFAVRDDEVWLVKYAAGTRTLRTGAGTDIPLQTGDVAELLLTAPASLPGTRAFLRTGSEVRYVDHAGSSSNGYVTAAVSAMTHDGTYVFLRLASDALARGLVGGAGASPSPFFTDSFAAVGSDGLAAFGARRGGGLEIVPLVAMPPVLGTTTNAIVGKLVADASHVYWLEDAPTGRRVARVPRAPLGIGGAAQDVGGVPTGSADLYVDPSSTGCLYYWAGADLHVRRKGP